MSQTDEQTGVRTARVTCTQTKQAAAVPAAALPHTAAMNFSNATTAGKARQDAVTGSHRAGHSWHQAGTGVMWTAQ